MTEEHVVEIILEGRHFLRAEDVVFSEATFHLSHLNEWYQTSGMNVEVENADDEKRKLTVSYQRPNPIGFEYIGGYIEFGHNWQFTFPRFLTGAAIVENVSIYLRPDKNIHMLAFLNDCVDAVSSFIALCQAREVSIIEIHGRAAADCADKTPAERKSVPTIKLHLKRQVRDDEGKELLPHDMVCTFEDVRTDIKELFKNWICLFRAIKPVLRLFLEILGAKELSTNLFLNSVQAIEAFHRLRRGGQVLTNKEYEALVLSAVSALPDKHKKWFSDQLKFGNEIPLRKRLVELLKQQEDLFGLDRNYRKTAAFRIKEISEVPPIFWTVAK